MAKKEMRYIITDKGKRKLDAFIPLGGEQEDILILLNQRRRRGLNRRQIIVKLGHISSIHPELRFRDAEKRVAFNLRKLLQKGYIERRYF